MTKNPFNDIAEEYDGWFDANPVLYQSELEALKAFIPRKGKGLDIGTGTGWFADELEIGKSWTTDAPYRETPSAIKYAEPQQVTAVEMEAAALYAFAEYRQQPVVCFTHLTNTMAREAGDFEKGLENGSIASLNLVEKVIENVNS